MKYKFHPYERAVGLFVGFAILGGVLTLLSIMVSQDWLAEEVSYTTDLNNAKGVTAGSALEYRGYKVGEIDDVEYDGGETIKVEFVILKKFQQHMIEGSQIKVGTTIFGDKSFEIIKPEAAGKLLKEYAKVLAIEDSGGMKKLQEEMIVKVNNILTNLDITLANTANLSSELNKNLPEVIRQAPNMTKDVAKVMSGIGMIVEEMNELQPLIREMATKLPEGTNKAVQALEESIVVLRAMQKSFFLSSGAEEAREELHMEKLKRTPASK